MGKIKQLSYHEAQKIAAGEVIERPVNIIKELLENALDAGATQINLYVEDGGKKSIRIIDNGCGMDNDDAILCFNRHATSKLSTVEELESIETFGFRGEALASIAAVSTITLITTQINTHEGIKVVVSANTIVSQDIVAAPPGTDINISNLFDTLPARKKFLKKTETEWRAIQLLFNAFCFDYPHIHFSLFSENKLVHNCPPAKNILMRAQQLWDNTIGHHLIELTTNQQKHFSFEGIISNHQQYRYDRNHIYFFVNKRWVKNTHLTNALLKGYTNVIPNGRYPSAVITITVDPDHVDINIHPRKEEVKFLYPRAIETELQNAVKVALEKNLSQQMQTPVEFSPSKTSFFAQNFPQKSDFTPFNFDAFFNNHITTQPFEQNNIIPDPAIHINQTSQAAEFNTTQIQEAIPLQQNTIIATTPEQEQYTIIGQYKKTYIIIEKEEGLFLVDQHAAHERILYELFSKRFEDIATVQLLFPHTISMTQHEIDLITQHLAIFHQNGIIIEQSGPHQLVIQSLPVHLQNTQLEDLIKSTIALIDEYQHLDSALFTKIMNEKFRAQMACKAAIKAGDVLTNESMQQLLTDLSKTDNRFSCPHGRPTGWLFTLDEIERKFRRKT